MIALRALARVVHAGVDLFVAAAIRWFDAERSFEELSAALARRRMEDAERKAFLVGYHGPIDPAGQWLEDLSAGRIDHGGNRLGHQET